MMNTGMKSGKSGIQTHSHTQAIPIVLVGRKHQLDRVCGKRPFGRVPTKRSTNPNRIPKSKRSTEDRVAKQEIFKLIELLEWKRSR